MNAIDFRTNVCYTYPTIQKGNPMSKPLPHIHLIDYSPADLSVAFIINQTRWRYILHTPPQVDTVAYLAHYISVGKALAYARRRAVKEIVA